ncbi:hypothetical protein ES707_08972 [subsurface metagenome]
MRHRLEDRLPQLRQRVEGQLAAEHIRKCADDRPSLARLARRKGGTISHLRPALGVDVDAALFGIGRTRQDHVGAMRAAVAMGADVNDEGAVGDLGFVSAEQEQHVERTEGRHLGDGKTTAGEADIERTNPRRGLLQHAKSVPAVLDCADVERELRSKRQHRSAIRARETRRADQHDRVPGVLQDFGEGMLAGGEIIQRVRARADVVVVIGKVGLRADHADLELPAAPALADARVEQRALAARVGADDQQCVGLINTGNGRVEHVGAAAGFGVEGFAALHRHIGRAKLGEQLLHGEHVFDRREVTGNGADALAVETAGFRCDRCKGFLPGGRTKLAVLSDIGPVEPLRAQAVNDVARLVGNPLLVHGLVDARQDAHHLAAAGVDPDRGAYAVHHIHRLRLAEFPRTGGKRIGFRGQRAHRADVDEIALHFRGQRLLEIGRDLHVLAAAGRAHFRGAADFRGEADAARALDAAVHRGLDQRAQILVLDGALVLGEAAGVDAIAHRLVLQIALAALVADRAIQRMVDQQKLHHAFARLLHHRRTRGDFRRLALGTRAAVAHAPGAARDRLRAALHFDEAHPAIAGDRQPLMVAEARDFGARGLARLEQRVLRRHVDLFAIDDEFGHRVRSFAACIRAARRPHCSSMFSRGEDRPLLYSAATMLTGSRTPMSSISALCEYSAMRSSIS